MKNIIIISAPSGSGKTTLCKAVQNKFDDVNWSISCTTREKRSTEVDGVDYHFTDIKKFESLIDLKKFVEWEKVHGNYYGTLESPLVDAIKMNYFLLLELDVKGAMSIKKIFPKNTFSIFIIPPSIRHLRERLKKRGTDLPHRIEVRLQRFQQEMDSKDNFDKIMVNENLEIAKASLIKIINEVKKGA